MISVIMIFGMACDFRRTLVRSGLDCEPYHGVTDKKDFLI